MIQDYTELTKPRLTTMSVLTTLLGFVTGSHGNPDGTLLIHTLLGTWLAGGGANALNQYVERDLDALMRRTENRPLPSRRLRPAQALVFAVALSVAGPLYLSVFVNTLTGLLAALTVLTYIGVYTPLKRVTHWNTFIGAVPGALPAAMGWTAATGAFGIEAFILFGILFLWQLPHFYSIAWMYREDYERGGMKMITSYERNGHRLGWRMVLYCLALIPVSLAPSYVGMAGQFYFFAALTAGTVFATLACGMVIYSMAPARSFMAASIVYLSAIILTMMASQA